MRLVLSIFALCMVLPCFAQTSIEYSTSTPSDVSFNKEHPATAWGLSNTEWDDYELLRRNYVGLISSQISPLELLGIFASDPKARERYANLLAQRQLALLRAISEFEASYADAVKRLTVKEQVNIQEQNRILLITSYLCNTEQCRNNLNRAVKHAEQGGKVDILIRETLTTPHLRLWTANAKIPQHLIRNKQITVNHSHGKNVSVPDGFLNFRNRDKDSGSSPSIRSATVP